MTATPIPRTLALTDLRRSRRLGRCASCRRAGSRSRRSPSRSRGATRSTQFVREQVDAGRQAYVIYPLVEESEKVDLKAATEMADHLAQDIFPDYRVALLHGRMKADEKERVMEAFVARRAATSSSRRPWSKSASTCRTPRVMVVEHAERFGLSQLHQLRGRVGRGRTPVVLRPAVSVAADRRGARAAEGDDRHDRRLRDRRARSASCAARATSSARASPGCRRFRSAISCATASCWRRRAARRRARSTTSRRRRRASSPSWDSVRQDVGQRASSGCIKVG